MKFLFTQKALRQYEELPSRIQASRDKQLRFLLNNLRHRSLDANFRIAGDTYQILTITKHPK